MKPCISNYYFFVKTKVGKFTQASDWDQGPGEQRVVDPGEEESGAFMEGKGERTA